MKETTIITTVEITEVHKEANDCFAIDKDAVIKRVSDILRDVLSSDSVVVTNVQQFDNDNSRKDSACVDIWEELRQASRPLIEYIRRNWNPHTKVIVDVVTAEVVTGELVTSFDI